MLSFFVTAQGFSSDKNTPATRPSSRKPGCTASQKIVQLPRNNLQPIGVEQRTIATARIECKFERVAP
jgi:hypothetical protein